MDVFATRWSTGWFWVLLLPFQWWMGKNGSSDLSGMRVLVTPLTTQVNHWDQWRSTGWGWVKSKMVRRGGWKRVSSVGLRLATALEAIVSCRKVVQRSSFQDVHAIVDPSSTRNGCCGRDVPCKSPCSAELADWADSLSWKLEIRSKALVGLKSTVFGKNTFWKNCLLPTVFPFSEGCPTWMPGLTFFFSWQDYFVDSSGFLPKKAHGIWLSFCDVSTNQWLLPWFIYLLEVTKW